LRPDMPFDHARVHLKTAALVGIDEDANAARVIHDVFVGYPVWDGDDDFVAGINERLDEVEDGVFPAYGDHALACRVVCAEVEAVAFADCIAKFRSATRMRVLG